jgi:CubicO group peptidase (beta-lactamase class C family)
MTACSHRIFVLLLAGLAVVACGGGSSATAPTVAPAPAVVTTIDVSEPWVTATAPSDMDDAKVVRAVNDAAAMPRFRSLLIARHGKLVSENYFGGTSATTRFDVRSVTKSVVSALIGMAIAAGKVSSLDATVGDYVGAPYVLDSGDRAVTVRQLLTMTSRYQWNESTGDDYNLWIASTDHVQYLLDRQQNDPPNTFTYNSAAVNLLGVVLQRAVGVPLQQYADDMLFHPLGITTAQWEQLEPNEVNGGAGIKMSAQDLLRFGQVILQGGKNGTTQVIPASWIAAATTAKFPWHDVYGAQRSTTYGYLWWVADSPAIPAAFAWGYGGQFVYVVPSLDMVIVTTTEWQGISAEVDPVTFASQILTVIVTDILPAART